MFRELQDKWPDVRSKLPNPLFIQDKSFSIFGTKPQWIDKKIRFAVIKVAIFFFDFNCTGNLIIVGIMGWPRQHNSAFPLYNLKRILLLRPKMCFM